MEYVAEVFKRDIVSLSREFVWDETLFLDIKKQ